MGSGASGRGQYDSGDALLCAIASDQPVLYRRDYQRIMTETDPNRWRRIAEILDKIETTGAELSRRLGHWGTAT